MIDNIEKTKIDNIIKQIESNSILPKDLADKLIDTIKSQNSFIENLLNIVKKYEGKNIDIKTLEDLLRKFKKQSDMAKVIQDSIFPSSLPNNNIISITAKLFPMNETSGDFYDIIEIIPNSVYGLVVADISGHGVSAALITHLTKILFTNAVEKFISPKDVMSFINDEFCNILEQRSYFTSFYSIIDFPNKQMVYSSAGHPYNVKYNAQNKQLDKLLALDMIIGVVADRNFNEQRFDISIGDRLILYTDGISEARNPQGEMFGDERLSDLLLDNIEAPSNQLIELIEYKVKKFTQKDYFDDDVTIIIADIKSYKDEEAFSDKGYISKDETSRLIDYYKKSIKIKEEHNDKAGIVKDLKNLSSSLISKGQIQEAFEYIERAKSLAIELNDNSLLGIVFSAIGNLYYITGELDKTIDNMKKSLECSLSIDDKDSIASAYSNLSITYGMQGNFKEAKEYIFKALEIQENRPQTPQVLRSTAIYYNNLAIRFSDENNMNKSLEYFLKSLDIAEKYNLLRLQSALSNNIGEIYVIKNELDKALIYFRKGLRILEEVDLKDLLPLLFHNIAAINFYQGEKELAFYNLNKGIKISEKYNLMMRESSLKVRRAYQYIKINKIEESIDDLLASFTINQKIKMDSSEGQINIVIAILLCNIDKHCESPLIKEKYEKLLPFLEEEITPEYFFEKAIRESKSQTMNSGVFIPASYEYAIYLHKKGDNTSYQKAIELLKEAIKIADEYQSFLEKDKIKKIIIELKLENEFKELW